MFNKTLAIVTLFITVMITPIIADDTVTPDNQLVTLTSQ